MYGAQVSVVQHPFQRCTTARSFLAVLSVGGGGDASFRLIIHRMNRLK